MINVIAIAIGGALGALARHGCTSLAFRIFGPGFPIGVVSVNILGSFILGVSVGIFAHYWQPPSEFKMLWVIGFLGSFTTFSTFSLNFVTLAERGDYLQAAIYLAASVFLSIIALFAGMSAVRWFGS